MMNQMEDQFGELQRFSDELIRLGKEVSDKFKRKRAIEGELEAKEREARNLQAESFKLKEKLIKINLELSRLERRRKELEGR